MGSGAVTKAAPVQRATGRGAALGQHRRAREGFDSPGSLLYHRRRTTEPPNAKEAGQ